MSVIPTMSGVVPFFKTLEFNKMKTYNLKIWPVGLMGCDFRLGDPYSNPGHALFLNHNFLINFHELMSRVNSSLQILTSTVGYIYPIEYR